MHEHVEDVEHRLGQKLGLAGRLERAEPQKTVQAFAKPEIDESRL
jgi:hypothetical protein